MEQSESLHFCDYRFSTTHELVINISDAQIMRKNGDQKFFPKSRTENSAYKFFPEKSKVEDVCDEWS